MNDQERTNIRETILSVIEDMQTEADAWVELAGLGNRLSSMGIQYKQLGYAKLKQFLNEFQDILEFKEEQEDYKPPVAYVRPKDGESESTESTQPTTEETLQVAPQNTAYRNERTPTKESWLFSWASIPSQKIKALSELALSEKWYYGEPSEQVKEELPLLKNYLAYTFKRLYFEDKILIEKDQEHDIEYAAFNTGLVDKKYEYIYALFKQNTLYPTQYWYLIDFVVAGEDSGKTLIRLFNPLPKKANYFENKIENMLYDTSTGDLSCDYKHILTERTSRLPLDFLKDNCPSDFLSIDGVDIDEVYSRPHYDEAKKKYFWELGSKIRDNSRIYNRLKNRIEDAVSLALKRVEWNYKTAIPVYFPTRNQCSLLLPLALIEENHIDLALVVERLTSGAYQGQTVLPLNLAYINSRLVTRPDGDWLNPDIIASVDSGDFDDDD